MFDFDQILLAFNSMSEQLIVVILNSSDLIRSSVRIVARIDDFQQRLDARSFACDVKIQSKSVCIAVFDDASSSDVVKYLEIASFKVLKISAYCFPQLVILKVMIFVSLNDVLDELQQLKIIK
jgi:hypothetical protein